MFVNFGMFSNCMLSVAHDQAKSYVYMLKLLLLHIDQLKRYAPCQYTASKSRKSDPSPLLLRFIRLLDLEIADDSSKFDNHIDHKSDGECSTHSKSHQNHLQPGTPLVKSRMMRASSSRSPR